MTRAGVAWLMGAVLSAAALGLGLAPGSGLAQTDARPARSVVAVLQYVAPASATWGPSPAAPPSFAFGKPAEVLLVVPGGHVVRQGMPLEDAIAHATYVARQIGQPMAVTIPDPAGGPARVEYVGTAGGDVGK